MTLGQPIATQPISWSVPVIADAMGNAVFAFPVPNVGMTWTGTITIPGAPVTSQASASINMTPWGTWQGPNAYGPVQCIGQQKLIVSATHLIPGNLYTCVWQGVSEDSATAQFVAPSATTQPILNYGQVIMAIDPQVGTVYPGADYLGGGYIGSSPGVGFQLEMISASIPWQLIVVWTEEMFFGTGNIYTPPSTLPYLTEVYAGETQCTIADNLASLLPYVSFFAGPLTNGVVEVTGSAWTSPTNVRGTQALPSSSFVSLASGLLISQPNFSLGGSSTVLDYSPVLAPGPHQVYLEVDTLDNAGTAVLEVVTLDIQATIAAPLPINDTQPWLFEGTVQIPNIQPRIRFQNASTGAVDVAGFLFRSAGS